MSRKATAWVLAALAIVTASVGTVVALRWSVCRDAPGPGPGDDTALLQRAIEGTPNGSCLALASGALYDIEGTLLIPHRTDFELDGRGATLAAGLPGVMEDRKGTGHFESYRTHLRIEGGSDISVHDLVIDGPNETGHNVHVYEEEAGVTAAGADGVELTDLVIRETYGDAIEVQDFSIEEGVHVPSRDVTIRGLRAERIGRTGIAFTGTTDTAVVEDSSFEGIKRSVFDIEPIGNRHVSNVRIAENTIGTFGLTTLAGGGWGTKSDIEFVDNVSLEKPMWIKFVGNGLLVEGNRGAGVAQQVMVRIIEGDDIRIERNVQAINGKTCVKCAPGEGRRAISLGDVCDVHIEDNVFSGAADLYVVDGEPPSPDCSVVDGGGNAL